MARSEYGGGPSDWLMGTYRFAGRDLPTLESGTLTFYDAETGGMQYTDLLLDGVEVTAITVGDDGQIPVFSGPDGVTEMWADAGSTRVKLTAGGGVRSYLDLTDKPTIPATAADVGADPAGTAAAAIAPVVAALEGKVDVADLDVQTAALVETPGSEVATRLSAAFAGRATVRRGDFPMRLPRVLSAPPTVAAGASSSSVVAGTVTVGAFEPGAFTFLGGHAGVANPSNPHPAGANLGAYPYMTSPSPVAVEFWLDTVDATGRFEINWSGPASQSGMRVAVQQSDGSWGYASAAATFSHSNTRADLVTLGAAGVYRIRLEFAAATVFSNLYVGPTDTVTATRVPKRWIVVGDSFTEPTLDDSGAFVHWDGWVQQLAYLTGLDLWSAGSGGTGYLNPNTAGGRVKFRDRLAADVLTLNPDGIIWAGGINDGGSAPADVAAEALACFQAARAAGVPEQVVISPFWPKTLTSASPVNIVGMSDGIKAAAESLDLPYLNLLELPEPTGRLSEWAGTTTTVDRTIGSVTIDVAAIPAYMLVAYVTKGGWYVKIGSGANTEIRKVTNISGTGPYTLTLNTGITFAWTAGSPVVLSGASYMTGSGRQGATTGSGNADRYTGIGGTHPTKAGMLHIARTVAGLWAESLPF